MTDERCAAHGMKYSDCFPCSHPKAPEPPGCTWTYDDDMDAWETTCHEAYYFIEDGPIENTYRFCPGCGQPISIRRVPEPTYDNREI